MAVPALALTQLAQSAFGVGKGISQAVKAKRLAKRFKRPAYEMPKSVTEQEELARSMFQGGLPGEAVAAERLGAATSTGVRGAKEAGASSAEILATVSGLHGAEVEGVRDLAATAAQSKLSRAQELMGALRYKAPFEKEKFEFEKVKPYEEAKAAESALRESSFQNIMKGISGAGVGAEALRGGEGGVGKEDLLASLGVTGAGEGAPTDIWSEQKKATFDKQMDEYNKLKRMGYDEITARTMTMEAAKTF